MIGLVALSTGGPLASASKALKHARRSSDAGSVVQSGRVCQSGHGGAGVEVHSMPWVTTVQLVRRPAFSEHAGQPWRGPRRESAAKPVHVLQPTSSCGT